MVCLGNSVYINAVVRVPWIAVKLGDFFECRIRHRHCHENDCKGLYSLLLAVYLMSLGQARIYTHICVHKLGLIQIHVCDTVCI